ncbi:MAG TPA: hypothetical protein DEF80_01040 [Pantoea sp.]|nr:hypothetical protein [Pantoea sp.]
MGACASLLKTLSEYSQGWPRIGVMNGETEPVRLWGEEKQRVEEKCVPPGAYLRHSVKVVALSGTRFIITASGHAGYSASDVIVVI